MNETCLSLGISVIGGHTEVTSAVVRPVASVTMFGSQLRNITSAGAKEGDVIVLTKSCGLEGITIFYIDKFSWSN